MTKKAANALSVAQLFLAGFLAASSGYNLLGLLLTALGLTSAVSLFGIPAVELVVGAGGGLLAAYRFGWASE